MDDVERRARLIAWFEAGHRDHPWRESRDPWAIWVSEVMLQQTRAASVVPYFLRFMERFPTPAALSAAPLDALLALWAGLGYYSRARNLHRAATQVVERHGGSVPQDAAALRALAGIGPYTAGAILSIAFDQPAPLVDGNVARVFSRWDRIEGAPASPAVQRTLWARAAALVQSPLPGALNQALMELGATLCTPRNPSCLLCPVAPGCEALRWGDAEAYPQAAARPERPTEHRVSALVVVDGEVWLAQRPETGLLAGLWELPGVTGDAPEALATLGLTPVGAGREIVHVFTHRRWVVRSFEASGTPSGGGYAGFRRVPLSELAGAGLTGPALKSLHAWGVEGAPVRRGAGLRAG